MKKILNIFVILFFIGVIITTGCTQSKSTTPATPVPTQKTQFNVGESASDGNLRITVVRHYVYSGSSQNIVGPKTKYLVMYVLLTLENLRSDKTIHFVGSDFNLLDNNNNVVSNNCNYGGTNSKSEYELRPGEREEVYIGFHFPDGTEMNGYNKLKFNFGGPSGGADHIVYFNL